MRVLEIEFNPSPSCCVDDCLKLKLSMSPEYVIIGDWWGCYGLLVMLTKMIGRLNFVLNLIIKFATYLYIINIFHYLCRYK